MRAVSQPIHVARGRAFRLNRLVNTAHYDEGWLQAHVAEFPCLLPVDRIEPGFERLVCVGRELPCASGYIDNLYLTPAGQIVLVEAKLWRNPQARREVVAQTLDYVAALQAMDYEAFETMILRAQHRLAKPAGLYSHMQAAGEEGLLTEPEFFDAVSANLRQGRMLALAVGDGVHAATERLVELLQSHAGSRFTFALVDLAIYEMGAGERLIVPTILLKTLLVERGVVRLSNATQGTAIHVEPTRVPTSSVPSKSKSISAEEFDEAMDAAMPGLSADIHRFVDSLVPLGVETEMLQSLNLRAYPSGMAHITLGYIQRNRQLWVSGADQIYRDGFARLIGGTTAAKGDWVVMPDGKAPRIEDILPRHAASWQTLIADCLARLAQKEE